MKQNITVREVALLLVSLAIIGLVITIVIYTLPGRIPSAVSITANSSPTNLAFTTPSPINIGSRQSTEAPYPGPLISSTPRMNTQTVEVILTQKAIAGTSLATSKHLTPFYEPTGVYSDESVQASGMKMGMDAQNEWFGFVGGNSTNVFAGALVGEPDQGVVHLFIKFPRRGFDEQILTPTKHGAVRVVSEHHNRLTLVSSDGATYYFDVSARRFVTSLTEDVPSATPPPTYTPFPLPGTVIPYPVPTEQGTIVP